MGVVGTIAAVVGTAAAVGVGIAAASSGGSRHSSGPRLTYEKQKRWDDKKQELESKRATLEEERERYAIDSNKYDAVLARKNAMAERLNDAKERLEKSRRTQKEQQATLEATIGDKTGAALLKMWEKAANNAVDGIKENCPRLDEMTSDLAEMHNKTIEQQTKEGFSGLQKFRDSQVAQKMAKIKDHQQALETRKTLQQIINRLEKLVDEQKQS